MISTAKARRLDPATSHIAARNIEKCGKAETDRARILDAVKLWPGRTSAELAGHLGMDRHAVARRLPELRDMGLVRNPRDEKGERPEKRMCVVMKSLAMMWVSTEKPMGPKGVQGKLFADDGYFVG